MSEMGIATGRKPGRPRTDQRQALVDKLHSMEVGETVTYAKLGEVTGMPDIRGCVHLIYDAKSECRRRWGFMFATIKNSGLKRIE